MLTETTFEIRDLSVKRGGKEVLAPFSLTVGSGELVALLGPNGAGKTTLLRAAAGLIPCTGSVAVLGQQIRRLNERRRAELLSYLPQTSGVGAGITVLDTVLQGYTAKRGIFGHVGAPEKKRARDLLAFVGLSSLSGQDISAVSQGEKQLAVFCRAAVQNAPVMLLDEPDGSLDFSNRGKLLTLIRNTVHENGYAGLIAIHDPNFALAFCDRIVLLSGGAVAGELSPKTASEDDVRAALSPLYGNFGVTVRGGVPFILPEVQNDK